MRRCSPLARRLTVALTTACLVLQVAHPAAAGAERPGPRGGELRVPAPPSAMLALPGAREVPGLGSWERTRIPVPDPFAPRAARTRADVARPCTTRTEPRARSRPVRHTGRTADDPPH